MKTKFFAAFAVLLCTSFVSCVPMYPMEGGYYGGGYEGGVPYDGGEVCYDQFGRPFCPEGHDSYHHHAHGNDWRRHLAPTGMPGVGGGVSRSGNPYYQATSHEAYFEGLRRSGHPVDGPQVYINAPGPIAGY